MKDSTAPAALTDVAPASPPSPASLLRGALATLRNVSAKEVELEEVSATEARNEFAHMMETAARRGVVVIHKQSTPRAVLVSFDEFRALVTRPDHTLDVLTAEFDRLLARMQAPGARAGMKAAFNASPDDLGAAALAVARRRRKVG